MATYPTLKIGSRGDDVKKLQEALKAAGYDIGPSGADGIYGNKTAAAVKEYQKKLGLSVDGIAGNQTLGSLYGGTSSQEPTDTPATTPSEPDPQPPSYTAPDPYTSKYDDAIAGLLDKITNRDKFSYDINGDALYQQYKDQFINKGNLAMQDTIGQASAMTGGFGNSYAQSVGQQTYQGYLQQLNDKVPELYQLALDQYNREGDDMYKQLALLADRDESDYNRHRDNVSDSQWKADHDAAMYQFEQEYKLRLEEIEEDRRHNRITEEQAQQQIDIAKAELELKKKSYSSSGSSSTKKNNTTTTTTTTTTSNSYANWSAGDWESYFAQIRQSEGKSAAEEELQYFINKGLIPKNMVSYGAIGARGGSMGH